MSLKHVLEIINEIASVSSTKEKEKLIKFHKDDPDFYEVINLALNPFKHYNTNRVFFVPDSLKAESNNNIYSYLKYLAKKTGATNEDINTLSKISSIDEETVQVVYKIINKDLDCGASIKTFKKFIPTLPEYKLMKCNKDLEMFFKKCNNNFSNIWWSTKIDGVRTSTLGNGIYLSRDGKEFPNFNVFDKEIKKLKEILNDIHANVKWDNVVIDGEGVINDPNGNADFQSLMTQIRRLKEIDSSKFEYYIFDVIINDLTFEWRYKYLKDAFEKYPFKKIKLLNHESCENFSNFDDFKKLANEKIKEGYEGLVIKNKDAFYERKRSQEWCKIKEVHTLDVKVTGWEYGKKKYSQMIGNFNCEFANGIQFQVGSGLSDDEREYFMENIPQIIEIEYQEITKNGKPRFPIFKRVRDDKDLID